MFTIYISIEEREKENWPHSLELEGIRARYGRSLQREYEDL